MVADLPGSREAPARDPPPLDGSALTESSSAPRTTSRLRRAASAVKRFGTSSWTQDAVLFLIPALASLAWFGSAALLSTPDSNFPSAIGPSADRYFEVWDFRSMPGSTDVRKLAYLVPWAMLLKGWAFASLPFDPGLYQRAVLVGLLWASEMSAYALFRVVTGRLRYAEWRRRLGGLLAGVLFGFNFYSMLTIWSTLAYLMYGYAFLPLVLALVLYALRRGPNLRWALLIALLWTLTVSPAYVTTPVATTDIGAIWVVALVSLVMPKLPWRIFLHKAKFLVVLTVAWVVFNLLWLLPVYFLAVGELGIYQGSAKLLSWNSAPLGDAFRLAGYAGLRSEYRGSLDLPWSVYYDNPLVILIGFVPAVFGFLGIARRRTPELFGLAALWCIALFLVKGPLPPFGAVNDALFGSDLLATAYRSTYQRFMGYVALALAVLAPVGVLEFAEIAERAKSSSRHPSRWHAFSAKRIAIATCLAAATLTFAYTGPLVTGSIYVNRGIVPNYRVTLPPAWSELATWLDSKDGDFAILPYPYMVTTAVTALLFDNGSKGLLGLYPLITMSSKPIAIGPGRGADLAGFLARGELPDAQALDMLNVRYVLVHMDANTRYLEGNIIWVSMPPQDIIRNLTATPGMRFVRMFGDIAVFENTRWASSELLLLPSTSGVQYGLPSFVWKGIDGRLSRWDVKLAPSERAVADRVYEIPLGPAMAFDSNLTHFAVAREDPEFPLERPLPYWMEPDPGGSFPRLWIRAGNVGPETTFHLYALDRPLQSPEPSQVYPDLFDSFENRSFYHYSTVIGNWTFAAGTAVDGNLSAEAGPVPSAIVWDCGTGCNTDVGVLEGWFRFDSNATIHFPLIPIDASGGGNYWAVPLATGDWGFFDGQSYRPYPLRHSYAANAWTFVQVSFDLSQGRFWTAIDGVLLTPAGLPALNEHGLNGTTIVSVRMQNVANGDTGRMWVDAVRYRPYAPSLLPLDTSNPTRLDLRAQPASYEFMDSSHTDIRFSIDTPTERTLVWLRSFDPGWRLVVNGVAVDGATHFAAFGTWNGWALPGNGTGSFALVYEPQRLVSLSIDASLFAMALAATYVLTGHRLRQWRRKRGRDR